VSVALPLDVYRAMHGPQLSELMMFNGRNAQVPHAIRSVRIGATPAPDTLSLPLFPLHAPTGRARSNGAVALDIERDAHGRVLRIAVATEATKQPPAGRRGDEANADAGVEQPPIAAYVLDAREAKRAIVALQIQLLDAADERVLPIRLEASEDLVSFVDVPIDGALIQLGHGGQRIDRDQISLSPTRAAFYRLSAARGGDLPTGITGVVATLAALEVVRPFEKVAATAQSTPKPQVFRFDLGGPVPVDRVEFELPENNTIVNVELLAAPALEGPYSAVTRARLYRIAHAGAELKGPMLEIARRNDRYYELRASATGGGLGAGQPRLITYHAPDELLFLRRGEGPFLLAYGRYRVEHSRFDADDLLSLLPDQPAPTASGTLAERKTLGGLPQLSEPKPPPPYKTYAVWAVLIAGVALLGGIALRLARSTERRP
jgi:hypothetical protein